MWLDVEQMSGSTLEASMIFFFCSFCLFGNMLCSGKSNRRFRTSFNVHEPKIQRLAQLSPGRRVYTQQESRLYSFNDAKGLQT